MPLPEEELADLVGGTYADLGKFLRVAYPWREPGELAAFDGPEDWTMRLADDISEQVALHKFDGFNPVPTIYVGIGSGNGCAKSTFAAFLVDWIMSTRPFCQGTVTANTQAQLRSKTWSQMEIWTKRCVTSHWFEIQAESIRHKVHQGKWACNALTWSIKNPQAFAGQHARTSTSFYLWDEASHIPEPIMEQADGGLTDGEPMWFMFGNPGNRSGRLYRSLFGDLQGKYLNRTIDSRTCKYTNKVQIAEWEAERGEDSDWFRVHVKGLAPNADALQFIDNKRVQDARKRELPHSDGENEPLIMGIDFARGGSAWNRITFRRGRDMRSIPCRKIAGEKTRDTTLMISIVLEEIRDKKPDAVFGDAGGIGGPIMDGIRQLVKGIPVIDVQFGGKSPDERSGNWRAFMYMKLKDWLPGGCIEDSQDLEDELTAPEQFHSRERLFIESKEMMDERGIPSPDWADSEVLTFAAPVIKKQKGPAVPQRRARRSAEYGGRGWMRR